MKLGDRKLPSFLRSRTSQKHEEFLDASLASSFALSAHLTNWSSSCDPSARLHILKFHEEWQHPECPTMKWNEPHASRRFKSIQHWQNVDTKFYHEFLIILFTDGSACRVERMGDGSRADALLRMGCPAYDLIQWFSAKDHAAQTWSRGKKNLIIQVDFPRSFNLLDILAICYTVQHKSPRASKYTLQRYNCYFLCNTILLVLTRRIAEWETQVTYEVWGRFVDDIINELKRTSSIMDEQHALEYLSFGICSLLDTSSPDPAGPLLESIRLKLKDSEFYLGITGATAQIIWIKDINLSTITLGNFLQDLSFSNSLEGEPASGGLKTSENSAVAGEEAGDLLSQSCSGHLESSPGPYEDKSHLHKSPECQRFSLSMDTPVNVSNTAAVGLYTLLSEVNLERYPLSGLDLASVKKKKFEDLSEMCSKASAEGADLLATSYKMKLLEDRPPLLLRLTASILGPLACIIPMRLAALYFMTRMDDDERDEMVNLLGKFGVTLGQLMSVVPLAARLKVAKVLFLLCLGYELANGNSSVDIEPEVFSTMLAMGYRFVQEGAKRIVSILQPFLCTEPGLRNVSAALAVLNNCFPLEAWEFCGLACLGRPINNSLESLLGQQVVNTVFDSMSNAHVPQTIRDFQASLLKRIGDHAKRVESYKLAAAPLVQREIERSMAVVWLSLPSGFGACEVQRHGANGEGTASASGSQPPPSAIANEL